MTNTTLATIAATTRATRFWVGTNAAGDIAQFWTAEPRAEDHPGLTIAGHVVMPLGGDCAIAGAEPIGAAPVTAAVPAGWKLIDVDGLRDELWKLSESTETFGDTCSSAVAIGIQGCVEILDEYIAAAPAAPVAAPVPAASEGHDKIVTVLKLNGHQLAEALGLAWPDHDDADQGETEMGFWIRKESQEVDGINCPAGVYAYWTDYPEEGSMHLPEEAAALPAAPSTDQQEG